MKEKLFALFFIIGGVLYVTAGQMFAMLVDAVPILYYIGLVLGGFVLANSFYTAVAVFGGKVWGMNIKPPKKYTIKQLLSYIGAIIGGFFTLTAVLGAFSSLFNGRFVEVVLTLVCYIASVLISFFVAKSLGDKAESKETYAMALGNLPIFKEIDANISEAESFVVAFEGVALFSKTDYCYAVYRYEDYQLGDLSLPKEVAVVGTYFLQKYHEKYTYKVDSEVIPGEPGQTVVAVGTGGVAVGRTSGVPDQRIFRSYIFTRKK